MKGKRFIKNLVVALIMAVILLGTGPKLETVEETVLDSYTCANSKNVLDSNPVPKSGADNTEIKEIKTEEVIATANYVQPVATETQVDVYKYCPTCINGTLLYCSNESNPGKVKDGIYLDGVKVLSTSKNSWDSAQVCDPTVIKGEFSYNNEDYKYLMAYLGCATLDCTANEIGFAVSNDLRNWTKTGKVVSAKRDGYWGVGQPSLINYDDSVFLFYTSGTAQATTTYVEQLDCKDLNNVQRLGIQHISCSYDFISNADFAYDDGELYMTCDTHPFPDGALNFVSAVQSVYSSPWDGSLDGLGSMNWSKIAQIGIETTGHERNHNGCFYRNEYGQLTQRTIYVTTADSIGSFTDNLYTYRFAAFEF